jgi:hypothetical protein
MSLISSFYFMAKELYSFKTRQCFCSWTLDVPVGGLCLSKVLKNIINHWISTYLSSVTGALESD